MLGKTKQSEAVFGQFVVMALMVSLLMGSHLELESRSLRRVSLGIGANRPERPSIYSCV
jgi:hypothetical protein